MSESIEIAAVGVVCTREKATERYIGVNIAQGFALAFYVTDDGGVDIELLWRGVTVHGVGDDVGDAYCDLRDTAQSFVPRLYSELVALEWAAHIARRKRQAEEDDGYDFGDPHPATDPDEEQAA